MKPKPIWAIIISILIFVFIVVTFLNCGREAEAATGNERVRKNKIADTSFYVNPRRLAGIQGQQAVECKRVDATYAHENYLNNRLFAITLVGRWCYDGKHVISHRWNRDQSIGDYWWSNWRFEGWSEPIDTGGDGMRYVFRRVKGTFGVNILWFERNPTRYVQCTLRGDGTFECGKG